MRKCRKFKNRFSDFIEHELQEKEKTELLNHIDKCHNCANELLALQRTIELTKKLVPVEPSLGFDINLHRKLQQQITENVKLSLWERIVGTLSTNRAPAVVTAVTIMVLSASLIWWLTSERQEPVIQPTAALFTYEKSSTIPIGPEPLAELPTVSTTIAERIEGKPIEEPVEVRVPTEVIEPEQLESEIVIERIVPQSIYELIGFQILEDTAIVYPPIEYEHIIQRVEYWQQLDEEGGYFVDYIINTQSAYPKLVHVTF